MTCISFLQNQYYPLYFRVEFSGFSVAEAASFTRPEIVLSTVVTSPATLVLLK